MRIHGGALSSSRRNEKHAPRAVRAPVGIALAVLLSVGGLTALATPSVADTAPPQGWASGQMPLPSDANANPQPYTASATCPVQNQCVTVGWYRDIANDAPWGLIEMQNGSSLTGIRAPQPSNAGSGANQNLELGSQMCGVAAQPCQAVACPTASIMNCFAVGDYENNVGDQATAARDGGERNLDGPDGRAPRRPRSQRPGKPAVDRLHVGDVVRRGRRIPQRGRRSRRSDRHPHGHDVVRPGGTRPLGCRSDSTLAVPRARRLWLADVVRRRRHLLDQTRHEGVIDMLSGGTWTSIGAPVPGDTSPTSTFSQLFRVACPADRRVLRRREVLGTPQASRASSTL